MAIFKDDQTKIMQLCRFEKGGVAPLPLPLRVERLGLASSLARRGLAQPPGPMSKLMQPGPREHGPYICYCKLQTKHRDDFYGHLLAIHNVKLLDKKHSYV